MDNKPQQSEILNLRERFIAFAKFAKSYQSPRSVEDAWDLWVQKIFTDTASRCDLIERLQCGAGLNIDSVLYGLPELLRYKKMVSNQLLHDHSCEIDMIEQILEQIDNNIKAIIGI